MCGIHICEQRSAVLSVSIQIRVISAQSMLTPGVVALLIVSIHPAAAQSAYELWSFAVDTTGGDVQVKFMGMPLEKEALNILSLFIFFASKYKLRI